MTRAVIIGRDNPISTRPEHALYPWPQGCTGWRLWRMLCERQPDVGRRDYLRAFERHNLTQSPWSLAAGHAQAELMMGHLLANGPATVLLLGEDVRIAFGLPKLLIHPLRRLSVTFRQVPHPSGRNPWYNEPVHRVMVGMVLEEMYALA